MKKCLLFLISFAMIFFSFTSTCFAERNFQPKGYIQNHMGEQCWYTQKTVHNIHFFIDIDGSKVGFIEFDDQKCMTGVDFKMDINKMMINNIISRWYSHRDANFQTRVPQLYQGSSMQKKGYCIQSEKYPLQGIMVYYEKKNDAIIRVLHSQSIGGCKQ